MPRAQHQSSSLGFLFGGAPAPTTRKSSNAYASGSNQNAGNVITDRPTTKVHAPPGGRSQISIGGYGGSSSTATRKVGARAAAPAPVAAAPVKRTGTSANAFASGSNQNAGNFITDRPTTRVHAPPGGRSQISFGGGSSACAARKPAARRPAAAAKPALAETSKANICTANVTAPSKPAATKRGGTSANAFASGSNQNAGNFITDRPTTRVHAPPGGRSQIMFG